MIALNNINISYGNLKVLENFSISLENGKVHCVFGASGCGKTTLLNALTGINKIESGEKESLANKKFSYVFQEDRLLPWATALENVLFVLRDRYCDEEAKQIAEKFGADSKVFVRAVKMRDQFEGCPKVIAKFFQPGTPNEYEVAFKVCPK